MIFCIFDENTRLVKFSSVPQSLPGGVIGHRDLGKETEDWGDLFGRQFSHMACGEKMAVIMSWEGDSGLGLTSMVPSFTTGRIGGVGSHHELGRGGGTGNDLLCH